MKIICIVGPTAVGKTKLSVELAKKLNGEIINADSTQVYKKLDIATAKVTEEEKEGIPHYLFDIKDIIEDYTVFDYQKDARKIIKEIVDKGKIPILVGGTGLYIKACLYDYQFELNNEKRDYKNYTNEQLYQMLLNIDKKTLIHKNNRKRVERAINYFYETGKAMSEKEITNKLLYDVIFIGLTTDREILYNRINLRVDKMFEAGLLDEAKSIYESNIRTKAVLTPIGYKELFPYFDNEKNIDECIELIKQNSRKYAKRQYTWLNHQMNVEWFDVNFDNFDETVDQVLKYIKEKNLE